MALLLTRLGRVELARSWHRDLTNENDFYHFTIGKTTPWEDEESPDTPVDSEYSTNEFRRDIMFTQKLSSADVCHIVNRIDWIADTVYDPYDDIYSPENPSYTEATNLADARFYVITDEFKVYKCLDNNKNSVSTVKPSSTGTGVFELADGYKWKFLFQVSASDQTKFLDVDHIPVRKLTGNPTHDVNGEIDNIVVTAGGSGYTSVPTVLVNGDGVGATATATITGDAISSIAVDAGGSGYSFAFITITGGGGSGATASVSLGDADSLPPLQSAVEGAAIAGTLDRVVMTNSGQDYSAGDVAVTITGDGVGAEATVTLAAGTGAITSVTLTNQGSGYTFADITFTQTAGVGSAATARAVISPIEGHGSNPVRELFSSSVAFVTSLSDSSNEDLILGNDFRQVGLVKNFYNYDKTTIWTGNSATACFVIDVDDETDYAQDDVITTGDGGKFIVIQLTDDGSGTHQIYLQPIIGIITAASTLKNDTQNISGLSINSVTDPEINVTTGNIVYMENRSPISRASDQIETIKALVNF